ncbi:ribosome small subunit-dependent GTPase A [Proteinivorax tanatarense]|uniref:Small ribosomal subunit biogenesis GTPase RsgA n=1 Tax=Proteinivorax tanatarense TaxID=1260629 RepID=A0AAU7VR68_9FIRM
MYKALSGFYYVKAENNSCFQCKARGKLKKEKIKPFVGDKVEISTISTTEGVIEEVLPRKNLFHRPTVSNIDQLVIMIASEQPKPDFLLVDTLLALAESHQVESLICVTKVDLNNDIVDFVKSRFSNSKYPVLGISNKSLVGIENLRKYLSGKISCLSGQSGVGKSSLINTINKDVNFKVGDISRKIKRGKHTTTHSSLVEIFDNSFIVDTPGFSNISLEQIDIQDLPRLFNEFELYSCKFSTCSHTEENNCGVIEAVKTGDIHLQRYNNYLMLRKKIKQIKERY